jgi:hypothetical protein
MTKDTKAPIISQTKEPVKPKGFQPGNKLGGRKLGARNKATLALQALQKLTEESADMALLKIRSACEKGDIAACKIIYDKCLPNAKPGSIPRPIADIQPLSTMQDALEAMAHLVCVAANGECTLEEAQGLQALVSEYRKTYETSLLEPNMEELQYKLKEFTDKVNS